MVKDVLKQRLGEVGSSCVLGEVESSQIDEGTVRCRQHGRLHTKKINMLACPPHYIFHHFQYLIKVYLFDTPKIILFLSVGISPIKLFKPKKTNLPHSFPTPVQVDKMLA